MALVTTANGGNNDHLSLFAPVGIAGGAGDLVLHGGTDLLLNDTGFATDVQVAGTGSLFGTAGRDVILGPNVVVRSATGAIENIPPFLQNLSGPQIENTGNASVTFDFGRALEQNFTATVDWADGTVDVYTPFNPGTMTAFHNYTGNPNEIDQAAPIPVSVTLQSDSRIHFTGYEFMTLETTLEFPGDGVRNVRIDTSVKVPQLSFPAPTRIVDLPTNVTTLTLQSTVEEGGSTATESTEGDERVVILREVLPDGREGTSVMFGSNALADLQRIFAKLRTGRYRVYLQESAGQTPRLVVEIYVRDGKPTSPEGANESNRDRPDGAMLQPAAPATDSADEAPVAVGASDDDDGPSSATTATIAMTAATVLVGSSQDWSGRVDAALAKFRKPSRLKARPRRKTISR